MYQLGRPKKKSGTRGRRGGVHLRDFKGNLQLRFTVNGERYHVYLGLSASNPENWKIGEAKRKLVESDIALDRLDLTLNRYKAAASLKTISKYGISLGDLWDKYTEFKAPSLSQTTLHTDYNRYARHITRLPTQNLEHSVQIRNWLVANLSPNTAKRCLVNFSASARWGVDSGILPSNPFQGMSDQVKLPKSQRSDDMEIDPFDPRERRAIIEGFSKSQYYSYYTPLIKALFLTGARPSELIALQWKHVSTKAITFEQAITRSDYGLKLKDGLKTQPSRKLPLSPDLKQLFLEVAPPSERHPEGFIFVAPNGGYVNLNNLRRRGWSTVLRENNIRYRKLYQTRSSFITECVNHNVPINTISKWVGNSSEVLHRHYLGHTESLNIPSFD